MKTAYHTNPFWKTVLLCFVFSLGAQFAIAQGTSSTLANFEFFYYGFALAIISLVIASVLIMRRARNILGEYGLPLFNPEFPIFKRMTKSRTTVAIVMILLVLWGIYSVITYKAI